MFKEPYELSIWEDIVVPATETIPEHFDEKRTVIIGAHDMESPTRAYNVNLKEGINGELTLSFNVNYKYYDETIGELVDNPLFNLLTNERKLKLRIGSAYSFSDISDLDAEDTEEKWKDFIIKSSDKDSTNYIASFTAKELFVNELGKNGWSVTLDTQLENNYGSIKELGTAVLEGSDWEVSEDSYSPTERLDEPLFKTQVLTGFTAKSVLTGENVSIAIDDYIYPFYNSLEWNSEDGIWMFKSGAIQFLFAGRELIVNDADDNRIVIDNSFLYNMEVASAPETSPIILTGTNTEEALRGNRIVKTQDTKYDSVLKQYVNLYKVSNANAGAPINTPVYMHVDTEYFTSSILKNLLTNSSNFTATTAWSGDVVDTKLFPLPTTGNPSDWLNNTISSYLKLDCSTIGKVYRNEGPTNVRLSLIKDNVYLLRLKARWIKKDADTGIDNISGTNLATLQAAIRSEGGTTNLTTVGTITTSTLDMSNDINKKGYPLADSGLRTPYSVAATGTYRDEYQYIYVYLVATESISASDARLNLYITNTSANAGYDFCIEDIQLSEYKEDYRGVPIFIGEIPDVSVIENKKFYYIVNDEAVYLSSNEEYYAPLYRNNYESVRNLSIKESNYFNNIQSLAELFQVWVRFKTYHRKNGKILLIDGQPKKEVIFSQFAPNGNAINQAGFKYGINLQNVKRSVLSDSIATKVIVKNNNQQYATDGMASISRAHSNPSGENEIYNFNYYINQGLLNYNQVLADLYGMTSTDLAFLTNLKTLNYRYSQASRDAMVAENEIKIAEANFILYDEEIIAADEELVYLATLLASYNPADANYQSAKAAAEQMTARHQAFVRARDAASAQLSYYQDIYDNAQEGITEILTQKKALKLEFYKKYYRFIQEGTWTDDKYIDDDLYYLDAMKVASVSAFPKVSYSISALEIGHIEGYEAYTFKVGERTYIEDPEFFGYVFKTVPGFGAAKTPFKQDVIVSERTRNLDDPSKSTITIQNYKNQFEELFQKITATTQALQYESGSYNRAAGAITQTGEIDTTTLEKSFSNNAFVLSNSQNQNVIWDTGKGIEIANNENTNERMRIVAGGIFLSTDGGKSWKSGITGMGINTRYLLAGQIDVNKINLVQGSIPHFRWDIDGISAFYVEDEGYNLGRYVRFNQYGLYGTTQGAALEAAVAAASTFDDKVEAIKENSNFAVTWDGMLFQMQQGAVSLTPLDGLEIFSGDTFSTDAISAISPIDPSQIPYVAGQKIPLISLGRFFNTMADTDPHYGLRMRDKVGYVTLSTDINGEFWVQKKFYAGQKDAILAMEDEAPKVAGFIGDTVSEDDYTAIIKPVLDELGLPSTLPTDPAQLQQFYQEHSIRLWAGSAASEIYSAPFFVLEDGTLFAQNGLFKGIVHARGGSFEGLVTIGANDKNGINGLNDADIVMWAGKTVEGEDTSYNFSVDRNGLLFARNATIQGTINVTTGSVSELLIPDWHSGITSQGDVLFWINATGLGNPTTAAFYITQTGSVYTSKMFLRDGLYINPSEDNSYYQIGFNHNQLAMWAGADNADYNGDSDIADAAPFRVTYGGNVYAKYLDLGSGSLIVTDAILTGKLSLKQRDELEGIILDSEEGIRTSTFNSVQGWKISKNGDATFNNVIVRGELTSATFTYKSKNIMGGDLLLSPTYYHSGSDIGFTYNSQSGNIIFTLEIVVDDVEYNQSFWPEESDISDPIYGAVQVNLAVNVTNAEVHKISLEGLNGTVARIGNNTLKIDLTFAMSLLNISSLNGIQIELLPGISIASLGECGITLNASHPYGPAIVITDKSQTNVIITQLGRLEGVIDPYFDQLHGYGLYAQNAYLTGKLFLPNAGITDGDEEYEGSAIRLWAGASPNNKNSAPFIVTQDGSLYATKGKFSGIVEAVDSTFSGYLQTAGILIGEPGESFDSFYVAYDNREESEFPRVQDLILRIDNTGLNIWEGGLRAFSDYASGWRDGVLPVTPEIDPIYGYHGSLMNLTPFPYFSLVDNEEMRAYVTGLHVGRFELEGSSLYSKSVKISDGEITFIQRSATNNDFLVAESVVYNSTANIWKISMVDGVLSISSDRALNKFTIANGNNNNILVGLSGLLDVIGDAHISKTLGIGEHTIIKPYVSSSGENHNGLDFMI